jgi:long-chain fatty acid transport protein
MKRGKQTALCLAIVASGMSSQVAFATDGYFANGYGMKSIGMGGAAIAVAQEPFGGAVNPGAMSFLGNEWQLGVAWFSPHRDASRSGSGQAGIDGYADSDSTNFFIPEFGVNWKYRPDLAFGVTVYGNGGMNTDYPGDQIPAQSVCAGFNPNPGPYNLLCGNGSLGVDLMQLMIAPYASWQFVKGQSIGITPIVAYQRFKAEGLQAFDNPGLSTSPGSVTNNGYSDSWGVGVRIGYMGQFTEQFALGAQWASKVSMGDFGDYKGLFAQQGGFDIPSSFTVGAAIRPTNQWLIAVDFQRIFYDDAPSVNNPSSWLGYCAQGQSSYCLGGDTGAGFGWQNVDVWKIGVQYMVNDQWTLRAGATADNPISRRT